MLSPSEVAYLQSWQKSLLNLAKDKDLELIRCLRIISQRIAPNLGPPFNLEEHKKQTEFSDADKYMSSAWFGAIKGIIRRGDAEMAHYFRTVSDEVFSAQGFPHMLVMGPWLHPLKFFGGMCQALATQPWGRDLLNRRLYRNKFKMMTPVTEGSTREADFAKAILTMAETPEGRKHLETYLLEGFEGFFDWDRPATNEDSDDEECPPLESPQTGRCEPNFDQVMDELFAKVYREMQAEEELTKTQRHPSPSTQASALSPATAELAPELSPAQASALPSSPAEPVCEAPTSQPPAPTPAPAEPARDPILDDILAGRTLTEHLQMFEISDAELDLSRQLLNGEVDANTAMRRLTEMFQGALPRLSSLGGRIVDI
jgi:hypothetical protein